MGEHVPAGDIDIWTEQVGEGPDVLLVGGLGDTDGWRDKAARTGSIASHRR
jgi:hypothetical protein